MTTHSSILSWRIPLTEELGEGYSPWDLKKLITVEQLTLLLFLSSVQSLQSCLTLCNPMDCSFPGSSVYGILQARIWETLPFPGDLSDPGIEPMSLTSPALAGRFFTASIMWDTCVPGYILGIVGSQGS